MARIVASFAAVCIFGMLGVLNQLSAQVLINEFLPDPATSRDTSEWIELYNYSDADVDLTGWTLDARQFPDGTLIPADGFLVVTKNTVAFTEEFGEQTSLIELNIGLTNGGDQIVLASPEETKDDVIYDSSSPSISWERTGPLCNDFIEHATSHSVGIQNANLLASCVDVEDDPEGEDPSPEPESEEEEEPESEVEELEEQDSGATTLLISEVYPSPLSDEGEWIELYNHGQEDISLEGWTLTDLSRSETLTGDVPAGEHLQIEVDRVTLNNSGDTLTLLSPDGDQIDQVIYAEIAKGESYARTWDGAEYQEFQVTTDKTPGEVNPGVLVPEEDEPELEDQPEETDEENDEGSSTLEEESDSEENTRDKQASKYRLPKLKIKAAKAIRKMKKKHYIPVWPGYATAGGGSMCWLCWDYGIFRKLLMMF